MGMLCLDSLWLTKQDMNTGYVMWLLFICYSPLLGLQSSCQDLFEIWTLYFSPWFLLDVFRDFFQSREFSGFLQKQFPGFFSRGSPGISFRVSTKISAKNFSSNSFRNSFHDFSFMFILEMFSGVLEFYKSFSRDFFSSSHSRNFSNIFSWDFF